MLKLLSEVAPKAVVAATVLWAGANYFVIGPQVASRVARADHMPVCEANIRDWATKSGNEKAKSIPEPLFDQSKEMALRKLHELQDRFANDPMAKMLGLDFGIDISLQQYAEGKKRAADAYNSAIEVIKQETATTLGKAGDTCGCLADTAISSTLRDWAMFSGTLGIIHPSSIANFNTEMQRAYDAGSCSVRKAGA